MQWKYVSHTVVFVSISLLFAEPLNFVALWFKNQNICNVNVNHSINVNVVKYRTIIVLVTINHLILERKANIWRCSADGWDKRINYHFTDGDEQLSDSSVLASTVPVLKLDRFLKNKLQTLNCIIKSFLQFEKFG